MTKNYFSIERNGQCINNTFLLGEDGTILFEEVLGMSYEEIKSYEYLDLFIAVVMDTTNRHFQEEDKQTIITLIDEDDIFVWGILIGPGDNEDELSYAFVDWRKDDTIYRYEKD